MWHKPPLSQVCTAFMLPVLDLSCPGRSVLLWGHLCANVTGVSAAQHFDKSTHPSGSSVTGGRPEMEFYFDTPFRKKCLALLTLHIKWVPCIFYSHPYTLKSASKAQTSFDEAGAGSLPLRLAAGLVQVFLWRWSGLSM